MFAWATLLHKPDNFEDGVEADAWFTQIANRLLNGAHVLVNNEPHRLVEIEIYYHGEGHPDPFTHRDPLQKENGRWYFHRTRGTYRGGSFKGIDLTFGDGKAFGGVLIRSIETASGTLIDGPSLCVDHLLAKTGTGSVAELDTAINNRVAWEVGNPLTLVALDTENQFQVVRSARVGLSLKRGKPSPVPTQYILRPYRFLSEPRRISKGKVHMVLALYVQGHDPERIREMTGCPKQSIQRYIEDFETGQKEGDFNPYFGIDLGSKELCRLHGVRYRELPKHSIEPGQQTLDLGC